MSGFRKAVALAALTGAVLVSGCGNETDRGVIFKSMTQSLMPKKATAAAAPTQGQLNAAVEASLAQTELPLMLAVIETRGATAILVEIGRNGGHVTWGTADRRSVITKGGIVTATRGLGNDIMSSEAGGVEALVAGRRSGSATRAMRFLDGENHAVEVTADCQVTRGAAARVSIGELRNVAAVEMQESCVAGTLSFDNSYLVDGRGRVVQSRQWLGTANGDIALRLLR